MIYNLGVIKNEKRRYFKNNQSNNCCFLQQKAADFAALFANNGEIILEKDHRILQPQIEQVTGEYFANLEYFKIKINDILIGENKALIEWVWEDFNSQTKQKKCHKNLIYLKFEQNLIIRWREYPV